MDIEILLKSLGDYLKVGEVSLNDNGVGYFEQEGDLIVVIEKIDDTNLVVYAPLGISPHKHSYQLEVFSRCLQGNLFYHETSGGSIGMDKKTDSLIYFKEFCIEAYRSDCEFHQDISLALDAIKYWREEFASCAQGEKKKVYTTKDLHLGITSHSDIKIIMP